MPSTEEPHSERQKLAVSISNAVVQVVRDHTGRGPTQARTYMADDLVTCVLRDTLTKGERTLVEHGRHKQVLDTRAEWQDTMESELTAAVEALTERKVIRLPKPEPHRSRPGRRDLRAGAPAHRG